MSGGWIIQHDKPNGVDTGGIEEWGPALQCTIFLHIHVRCARMILGLENIVIHT